ncbi:MAG: ABC transporter permease [Clostridiales bacterium]|nr:ABC transporter permease [Clostridiales bacterium]
MLSNILLAVTITFMYAAPLILTALGGVVCERSGVVNIGLEGMMVIGAFAGACVGYYSANPWVGFLAAGLAGGALAVLHAVASVTFKANQTVSGVALNFVGPGLALFLCRLFFDGATMSKPVPERMPKLTLSGSFSIDITFLIAVLLTGVIWFALYKTRWGLRLRAVGEHPAAADTLGVNVYAVRYAAVILSGVLAGFGGAAQSLAVVSLFTPTVISGQGFIAMAAVIFGKWTPHGALAACIVFAFAQAMVVMLGGGSSGISPQLLSMLPYLLTILVLVLFVGKAVAPRANGVPYEKGAR